MEKNINKDNNIKELIKVLEQLNVLLENNNKLIKVLNSLAPPKKRTKNFSSSNTIEFELFVN